VTGNTVVEDAMEAFENFARQSPVMSTGRMLMAMIERFDVFRRAISLGSVRQTEERLFFLIGKVEELSEAGFTLSDVIDYVDHVVDNGLDIDYAGATSLVPGAVNIMTIHKSKGLEFPVVYCPLLETLWRSGDASSVRFDQKHGVIIPVFDEGVKDPVETELMTTRDRRDNISERLRLLYVALTRAREQAVLVMDEKPDEPLSPVLLTEPVDLGERENYTRFADVIRSASGAVMRHIKRIGWDPELFGTGHLARLKEHQAIPESDMTITYRTLDITYDSPASTRFSMEGTSIPTVEETRMIALGTSVHAALETLDFKKDIEEEIRTKVGDPRVRAILSSVKDWPFLSDMENARIMKEHAFMIKKDGAHRHGVIDLLIESETSVIIVDYKLKDISKDAYLDQVRGYMDYARAMFKKEVKGYLWSILDGKLMDVT
jgi:ATP-dependent helicase/nuclease subunit A